MISRNQSYALQEFRRFVQRQAGLPNEDLRGPETRGIPRQYLGWTSKIVDDILEREAGSEAWLLISTMYGDGYRAAIKYCIGLYAQRHGEAVNLLAI